MATAKERVCQSQVDLSQIQRLGPFDNTLTITQLRLGA